MLRTNTLAKLSSIPSELDRMRSIITIDNLQAHDSRNQPTKLRDAVLVRAWPLPSEYVSLHAPYYTQDSIICINHCEKISQHECTILFYNMQQFIETTYIIIYKFYNTMNINCFNRHEIYGPVNYT